jgi:hypothetical protein
MATRPYKTTGCFRFAVFLLIFAPLAYLGASYYNGEDGLGNLKKIANRVISVFSGVKSPSNENSAQESSSNNQSPISINSELLDLKSAVERKDKEINALIEENLNLKMKLKECEGNTPPK